MARLTEAVAKEVLSSCGIDRPAGVVLDRPDAAALAGLRPPLFVKAQVPIGDRAANGAVVRADSADDAAALVVGMLGTSFCGSTTRSVLVEEAVTGDLAGYGAVRVADDGRARELLLLAEGGGAAFDPSLLDPLLRVHATVEPHEIRTALARQGHTGRQLALLTDFAHRLCAAAVAWSTYVLEVNPFVVGEAGVVVLDAKAEVDDYSSQLLPGPLPRTDRDVSPGEQRTLDRQATDHQGTLRYVQLVPEDAGGRGQPCVGSHAVGGGESMIVLDALHDAGLRPTNYCDTSGSPSREKVALAAEVIASQRHIGGYFFSSCIANQPLSVTAAGLLDGFRAAGWTGPTVLRIAGNEEEEAVEMLRSWGEDVSGPVRVFGREIDEWAAAAALADLVRDA